MDMSLAREHREQIRRTLTPGCRVLEWGSGGSTLWLANQLPDSAHLTSVEHHPEWYAKVCQAVGERDNVRLIHAGAAGPVGKSATIAEEDPTHLGGYVHAADTPAIEGEEPGYDVVFVDGVARVACMEHARTLLRPGGTVFLHDAHRPWYDAGKACFVEHGTIGPGEDDTGPILWWGGLTPRGPVGSASASPLIVSFYTLGTPYEEEVKNLRASCERLGLDHHLAGIPDRGSWLANQSYKPRFIRKAADLFDRPVLWVDADAVLRSPPTLLADAEPDFAVHKIFGWIVASGTVYFNRTRLARLLLDRWIDLCDADGAQLDQIQLDAAWEQVAARHPLRTRWLPQSYTKVFDHDADDHHAGIEPVVEHFQASRRHREAPEGMARAPWRRPEDELKAARAACRPRACWYDERFSLVPADPRPAVWREVQPA